MIQILKRFLSNLGFDWAIIYTSSARIIQAIGGIISIFLIATYLSKEEQGFYYTFASVLGLQIFFELGLGGIVTQFVAHEMAHLSIKSDTKIKGNSENISRLASLIHFCVKWYFFFGGLFFVSLIIFGFYFFSKYGGGNPNVEWKTPWVIIVIGGCLNLVISPFMAMLQGMGKVKEMARLALIQQLIAMCIVWISLVLGAKLYVAAINSIAGFVVMIILYSNTLYPRLLLNLYKQKINNTISYWDEIFPFQWRIALSWMSGYLIFQLFNPVIFASNGAIVAGQMGMTLAALNSILALALSWTTTKIPMWSVFIAKKNYSNLDYSFNKVLRDSTVISIFFILLFIIFITALNYLQFPISKRFLPLWLCSVLSLTIPFNNIINAWATYLRCHKKEPFLIQALIVGFLSAISTILSSKYIGVEGVVVGYATIVVFISVPLSFYIFINKKKLYNV